MKKLLTICFFLFCAFTNAQSPAIQWQNSYGGSGWENTNCIIKTTDGGYIVTGISESVNGDVTGNHGGGDYWIVKVDAIGNIQWQKTYGGSLYDLANSIKQTTDGGYIVAGVSISTNGDVTDNHGNFDYWILKLSNSGSVEWKKNLGGSGWDDASSIVQTTDGGYFVSGRSNSTNIPGVVNKGGYDYLVVKLDLNGNVEWYKSYGGSGDDFGFSMQLTSDNGYILSGYSTSNDKDVNNDNHGGQDYLVIKIDATGTIQWTKSLGGPGDDKSYSITESSDGGYVVAGSASANGGNVTGNHGNTDYWIVKLNNTGSILWQKSLGGSAADNAFPILRCNDNGYLISGFSNSNDGDANGNHGGFDNWVVKLNSNGNFEWQKSLGSSGEDGARSLAQAIDGGYVIFGHSGTNNGDVTNNHGSLDYWIVKLDALILPLNLLHFEAVKNKINVQLSWQTTNEINTSYFIVQRSANSTTFNNIGRVKAKNTSGNNDYTFTDASPVDGVNFYRLEMVDVDGKTTYSSIIKMVFENKNELQVFPNPAKNIITLNGLQNKGIIKIIAGDGKLVKQMKVAAGSRRFDISTLAKGIYILQYNSENKTEQVKFVKE